MYVTIYHFYITVRLVNGPTEYEGRVEVYHNGEWGTVCESGWDLHDAKVVCNELGVERATDAKHGSFYGKGNGNIWLNDVDCIGTELTIKRCSQRNYEYYYPCGYNQDAGVQCTSGRFIL